VAGIETVLISVHDKTGLPGFARRLAALGIHIISTGGTARLLQENEIAYEDVSDYTGLPAILDGRIKTLHHKVLAGLLALRDLEEHRRQMQQHAIRPIDMVVVNLYPFSEIITDTGLEPVQAITNIDIGGPTLIRAAAKNYTQVAVVTNPATYDQVAEELEGNQGALSEETHFTLGLEAFRHTGRYDRVIGQYLAGIHGDREKAPHDLVLELAKRQDLREGANPHQMAAFYVEGRVDEPCVSNSEQIAGGLLSFAGVADADAGIELIKEFDRPSAVIVRHGDPCGAGSADTLKEACEKAFLGMPPGAGGCALVVNRRFDSHAAKAVADRFGMTVLVAPEFDEEALGRLVRYWPGSQGVCILRTGALNPCSVDERAKDVRRVVGGLLIQDRDLVCFGCGGGGAVGGKEPSDEQLQDLRLACSCAKHARSNAAAVAGGQGLLGMAAGQPTAHVAAALALERAGQGAGGAVLAVDEALSSREIVELAAHAGVTAIAQSGGADADAVVIETADRLGLAMVFTGTRHLRY